MRKQRSMEKEKKKCIDAGYTLIELIVVLAIVAVLGGIGISFMGFLPKAKVNACAKDIVTYLEKTRTSSLSYEDASFLLYRKDDGIYMKTAVTRGGVVTETEEKIGADTVQVFYVIGTDEETELVNDGTQLVLKFNRSSGAFREAVLNKAAGVEEKHAYCTSITVRSGSSHERVIRLIPLTGKIDD